MENLKNTFGERLRDLRKEKNLRQSELGEIFGLSPSAIGSYERNLREPALHHLIAFAEYFGTSIDYLLCRTNEKFTINKYIGTMEVEYEDVVNKFNLLMHGYQLTNDDKRRLLDFATGLFWEKVNG